MKASLKFDIPDETLAFHQAMHADDMVVVISLIHKQFLATGQTDNIKFLESLSREAALPPAWFGISSEEGGYVEDSEEGAKQLELFKS